jgi:hypothetical protein
MHPEGQAKVYRAMATIPGVRMHGHTVEDATGRQALAFYLKGAESLPDARDELLIDPEEYTYVGYRMVAVRDNDEDGLNWREGDVVMSNARVAAALVGADGEKP